VLEFEDDPLVKLPTGSDIELVEDPLLELELEDELPPVAADKLMDNFWERAEVLNVEAPVIEDELAC